MDTALPLIATAAMVAVALAGPARMRPWAMLPALLLTPVLLLAHIWDSGQVEALRGRPALAAAAAVGALAAVSALAALFVSRPRLLPIAVAIVLPFRIPIELGGATANLLVPLYLVIAAGTISYLLTALRPGEVDAAVDVNYSSQDMASRDAMEARSGHSTRVVRALELTLAAAVLLYAVQASYSSDFDRALENVLFFYVPFSLLFILILRIDWSPRLATACLVALTALAVVFAGVGFYEYATRELLLNPKVVAANQFQSYFRVNSLFFDPNIYGRFLVIVMLGLAAVLISSRRAWGIAVSAALLTMLWAGLLLTFSQSSFAALLAGLATLAALRWSPIWTARAVVAALAVGAAVVLAAPSALHLDLGSSRSLDSASSGRWELVRGAAELIADEPVTGWGSGSFSTEYRELHEASSEKAVSASHTIPLTIAAEQGMAGLAVYVLLLVLALRLLFAGARGSPSRGLLAAGFVALVVHTMSYAAFLEDPLTWALLAAGVAFSAVPRPATQAAVVEPAPAAV